MTKLRLAPDLTLPLEAITETLAVLGIRGSGKTNTAAVYAEELLRAGQQVVVIDPTDSWWGLKSSADGQAPGYPVVVLGGKHADLPLAAGDGKLVAEFVVEQGASVICSLRGFESKQQELTFATTFLRRLYYLKGQQDAPAPLALMIDEASRLVPQRVMGEDAACVGAVQQIVRQGRSSGFGVVLIDQRAATVNKDVLAQLDMLIAHRTTAPQDRKALREWIVAHDTEDREQAFLESLASLKVGEAWVWSPGWLNLFQRVQVRPRRTFDSSRTPRAGEVVVTPKQIAEVDLEALRAKLAATIEKAKAEDPRELHKQLDAARREIIRLERARPVVDQQDVQRVVEAAVSRAVGIERARASDLRRAFAATATLLSQQATLSQGLATRVEELAGTLLDEIRNANTVEARADVQVEQRKVQGTGANHPTVKTGGQQARSTTRPPVAHRSDSGLPAGAQKLLDAAAKLASVNIDAPTRTQVAALAPMSPTSSATERYFALLIKDKGYLEIPDAGAVRLTDAGRAAATPVEAPPTLEEYVAEWQRLLGSGAERKLYDAYIDWPKAPGAIARAKLAELAGISSTSSATERGFAWLIGLDLLKKAGTGEVEAGRTMFPEGLV